MSVPPPSSKGPNEQQIILNKGPPHWPRVPHHNSHTREGVGARTGEGGPYTARRLTELPSELTTELLPTVLAMLPPCDFFLRRRRRAGGSGGVRSS